MYKRLSAILFPIMSLAFIGAAIWGYQENQEKNAVLIKAENQYQRAFHDLSYHMDQLHSEIGKTIAANGDSHEFYKKGLINVWRITSQAQNEINQLPLTLLPFNKTEDLLANVANFSYHAAMRDMEKQPLSQDEMKTLNGLYERSKEITKDLQDVQGKVLANNLRWMDVEYALATNKNPQDNTIVDGFKSVDKKVSSYDEINWGPSMTTLFQKRSFKALAGNELSPDEAKQKAAQFLNLPDTSGLQVTENGAGTEYNSFSVFGKSPVSNEDMQLDVTKKGGYVLSYLTQREVTERNVDLEGARDAAQEFLEKHGYADMTPVTYDEYNNVASIAFVRKQGNVILYPEKIIVKVALDHAEVTGFQGTDYVFEHKERQIPAPALTLEQAKKKLHPNFQSSADALALIRNDLRQEVLCYEFTGRVNGSNYKVYINAENGTEEKIEQINTMDQAVK